MLGQSEFFVYHTFCRNSIMSYEGYFIRFNSRGNGNSTYQKCEALTLKDVH